MHELLQNQFTPINETGINPVASRGGKILVWEYKPPTTPDLITENFVIAKPPGIEDQYILGPEPAVRQVANAFNLLDSVGHSEMRAMSVIINPYLGSNQTEVEANIGGKFISEYGKRFGLDNKTKGSLFDTNLTDLGVCPDIRQPIFVNGDISKWDGWQEFMDNDLATIFHAGRIRHEWAHVEQVRDGLPVNSLWAERCAMSLEANLLVGILNHNHLKKRQQSILAHHVRELSKRIHDYRNGRNFYDHLTSPRAVEDGSPLKKQNLCNTDFLFGQ